MKEMQFFYFLQKMFKKRMRLEILIKSTQVKIYSGGMNNQNRRSC